MSHQSAEAPLVSVILPAYNAYSSIRETLESALCQTYQNIEIIVIDDGSTDRTLEVVETFAARDSRIHIIRQENRGVAPARNRGLAIARGEFIAPLDADDLWEPTKIERQVQRMLESGDETGLVYCWWVSIDSHGTILDRSPAWRVEGDAFQTLLQVNYTGCASVPLFRRRCLEKAGGYSEKLQAEGVPGCEDWDLALRVAEHCRVAVVPALLAGYRRRPQSMSTNCEAMWPSQKIVTNAVRERQSGLAPAVLQQSEDQFALYLAGVSFWAGSYRQACAWAFRAWRSGLLFRILPYMVPVLWKRLGFTRNAKPETMVPGLRLDESRIPKPLIPYDRIYQSPAPRSATPVRDLLDRVLRSRSCQATAVVLAFLLIAGLNAHNNGLWYQGDSPRHAANGLFWWDFLVMHPSHPEIFALQYYARYPIISPLAYPPLFYLIEGSAFHIFGPSPYVAKGVVLGFAMLAGFYTMAWLRRWVGLGAGWAGCFLAFVPGVVLWTNVVMLNMPATALGLACLYHFRRWTESASRKQLVWAAASGAGVVLTYYPGAIALGVCMAWAVLFRKSRFGWRSVAWASAFVLVAALPLVLTLGVAPIQALRHGPTLAKLETLENWRFYPLVLPGLLGPFLLILGLAGLTIGLLTQRWRTETAYIGSWILLDLLSFSLLPAKSDRYILLAVPAFVAAGSVAIAWLSGFLPAGRPELRIALLVAGLTFGAWSASRVQVPKVSGFREVAMFLKSRAATEPVLYDGYFDGLFGFYMRASDPQFERRMVSAAQLLYHTGPTTSFDWVETVNAEAPDDVVNILRQHSGCRWVAVERGPKSEWSVGQKLLRKTLERPDFEFVRSFPVTAEGVQRIDVYQMVGPVAPAAPADLSFPSYSTRIFRGVSPITR